MQNSRYVEVLRSPTLAALLHRTPAAGVRETLRHDAWRPSRWASANILVFLLFLNIVMLRVVLCFNAYVVNKFHDNG